MLSHVFGPAFVWNSPLGLGNVRDEIVIERNNFSIGNGLFTLCNGDTLSHYRKFLYTSRSSYDRACLFTTYTDSNSGATVISATELSVGLDVVAAIS